jgi:hypothetical protein
VAVYVIVGLVVLAGLILAYRSLGGAAASRSVDPQLVLRVTLDGTRSAVADLEETVAAAPLLGARAVAAQGSARSLRRRLGGLGQQLAAIDAPSFDEPLATAHALLTVAVDELGWAAALCAGDSYAAAEGMRTAARALCAHAQSCLGDAAPLITASAAAEEVERSP